MSTPGAARSTPSEGVEKSAGSSSWSVAATVSTWGRLPGVLAATPSLRSFPDDATRIEPVPNALSSVSSSRRVYGDAEAHVDHARAGGDRRVERGDHVRDRRDCRRRWSGARPAGRCRRRQHRSPGQPRPTRPRCHGSPRLDWVRFCGPSGNVFGRPANSSWVRSSPVSITVIGFPGPGGVVLSAPTSGRQYSCSTSGSTVARSGSIGRSGSTACTTPRASSPGRTRWAARVGRTPDPLGRRDERAALRGQRASLELHECPRIAADREQTGCGGRRQGRPGRECRGREGQRKHADGKGGASQGPQGSQGWLTSRDAARLRRSRREPRRPRG